MKKNMILCFMLVLITMLILPIHTSAYDYGENDVIIDYLPGDIDGNKKLTSADARLCLRAAAKLDTLTEEQIKAADYDGTGEINSSNARKILRASAQLETLSYTVNLEVGQKLVVGPLKAPTGWEWYFTPSKAIYLDINTSDYHHSGGVVGSAPDKYVSLAAIEKGDYNIAFKQRQAWNKEITKSFDIIMVVS